MLFGRFWIVCHEYVILLVVRMVEQECYPLSLDSLVSMLFFGVGTVLLILCHLEGCIPMYSTMFESTNSEAEKSWTAACQRWWRLSPLAWRSFVTSNVPNQEPRWISFRGGTQPLRRCLLGAKSQSFQT